jgi:hypothetical protein
MNQPATLTDRKATGDKEANTYFNCDGLYFGPDVDVAH